MADKPSRILTMIQMAIDDGLPIGDLTEAERIALHLTLAAHLAVPDYGVYGMRYWQRLQEDLTAGATRQTLQEMWAWLTNRLNLEHLALKADRDVLMRTINLPKQEHYEILNVFRGAAASIVITARAVTDNRKANFQAYRAEQEAAISQDNQAKPAATQESLV